MSKNEPLDTSLDTPETTVETSAEHEKHRLSSAGAREFLREDLGEDITENEAAATHIEYSMDDEPEIVSVVEPSPHEERLHKLIARAGIASRRGAEEIIAQGRVLVNGIPAKEAGSKADPTRDRISVDGQPLRVPTTTTVVLMHKPLGVVSTKKDPEGRTTVTHLLPEKLKHLHPIGRLDYDTSGLLLLTDDGSLTQLLTHPSHGVEKVYWARVRGTVTVQTLKTLEAGIYLEDGKTASCKARVRAQTENNALVQLTLREGRNRQVRRMLEFVGHQVRALRRVRLGGLGLDELLPGSYRVLLPGEVHALRKAAEAKPKSRPKSSAPKHPISAERNVATSASARTSSTRFSSERPTADRNSARPTTSRPSQNASSSRPRFDELSAARPANSERFNSERFNERAPSSRPTSSNANLARPNVSRLNASSGNASSGNAARENFCDRETSRDRAVSSERFAPRDRAMPNDRAVPNDRFAGKQRAASRENSLNERENIRPRDVSRERFASTKRDAPRETEQPRERFSSSALTDRLQRQERQTPSKPHPVARRVAQSFEQTAPPQRDLRSTPSTRPTSTRPTSDRPTSARPNASSRQNASASNGYARPNSTSSRSEFARPNVTNRATHFDDAPRSVKPGKQAKPTRPPKAARVFAANTAQAAKNARNAAEKPKFNSMKLARPASPDSRGAANAEASSRAPKAKTDYSKPVARRGERPWGQKTRKRA